MKDLKLTVDTPRASTQPNPWGKPGGPGLWHHKNLQLPPYIQNVSKALARGGLGESEAIHKAVGIVKDWAAGRTPNGKGRVHPDVQAAAVKAIAEWNAKRAEAHASSASKGKVAATMTDSALDRVLALAQTDTATATDPHATMAACVGQACDLLHSVSLSALPDEVQHAVALMFAANHMSNTDPSTPSLSGKVDKFLALNGSSDSDDDSNDNDNDESGEQDLNGGTLMSSGAVMMGPVRVGLVSKGADGYVGKHRSGVKTSSMKSRKSAGNAVIKIHKNQKG